MLNKSQSISVRLSQEDYAYLMRIDQNGAMTQSEKVREIIHMARDQVGPQSFTRAYLAASESIAPYRALNKENPNQRSEIIDTMLDLVSEVAASIQATDKDNEFVPNLESRMLPVAEDLISRLLPKLISVDYTPMITRINENERKARLRNLVVNLQNQITQAIDEE